MTEIPERVLVFLRESIDSVEQLEILLLLRRNSEKEWTAEEVSRVLFTHSESAASRLAEFHRRGILALKTRQGGLWYQYRPRPDLDTTIGELADAYSRYPVRLINLIFSKPIDKIRTFADAFKLRKENEE